jgi:hypothetical protein
LVTIIIKLLRVVPRRASRLNSLIIHLLLNWRRVIRLNSLIISMLLNWRRGRRSRGRALIIIILQVRIWGHRSLMIHLIHIRIRLSIWAVIIVNIWIVLILSFWTILRTVILTIPRTVFLTILRTVIHFFRL